jgi:hypothetical protein
VKYLVGQAHSATHYSEDQPIGCEEEGLGDASEDEFSGRGPFAARDRNAVRGNVGRDHEDHRGWVAMFAPYDRLVDASVLSHRGGILDDLSGIRLVV